MSEYRNCDTTLKTALEAIGIPVERLVFSSRAPQFIIYQHEESRPVSYTDDTEWTEAHTYTIHIYARSGHIELLRSVRTALYNAGFEDVRVLGEMYEIDTKLYHVPVQCRYLEIMKED